MSKAGVRDGDGEKMVHSEIYHGGYITADEQFALPNELVHLPSQNYVIVDIDVEEEMNERVDIVDQDDFFKNTIYFDNTMELFQPQMGQFTQWTSTVPVIEAQFRVHVFGSKSLF